MTCCDAMSESNRSNYFFQSGLIKSWIDLASRNCKHIGFEKSFKHGIAASHLESLDLADEVTLTSNGANWLKNDDRKKIDKVLHWKIWKAKNSVRTKNLSLEKRISFLSTMEFNIFLRMDNTCVLLLRRNQKVVSFYPFYLKTLRDHRIVYSYSISTFLHNEKIIHSILNQLFLIFRYSAICSIAICSRIKLFDIESSITNSFSITRFWNFSQLSIFLVLALCQNYF